MAWREETDKLPESLRGRLLHSFLHDLIRRGNVKDGDIGDLAQIAFGAKEKKPNPGEKTLFITGGLAIEDVAWGYTIYQQALKQGIGQKLALWNEPHWF
ncbi:MAG: hypothetical protein A2170_07305 [Deltaproteobacteria bacterium RBG_13_53_10]|nr:MAG: hypothetical protein A2170_07305 [Deltaproteobacteria bacterium RBG_13_53_10]